MDRDTNLFPWKYFVVTAEHVALLPHLNIQWDDSLNGAPCVDPKRPYGNGDMEKDIAKILKWKLVETREGFDLSPAQDKRADVIHREMEVVMDILCQCNGVTTGRYRHREYGTAPWEKCADV